MASSSTAGPSQNPAQRRRDMVPTERSKPCFNWQRDGRCRYGSKCKYLHSSVINPPAKLDNKDEKSNHGRHAQKRTTSTLGNNESEKAAQSSSSGPVGARNATAPVTFDSATKTGICSDWRAGRCTKGEECRYRHEISSNDVRDTIQAMKEHGNTVKTEPSGHTDTKDKICFDWKVGKCNRGDRCRYSHAIMQIVPTDSQISAEPKPEKPIKEIHGRAAASTIAHPVKTGVCFKWRKGKCTRGAQCQYRHEEVSTVASVPNRVEDVDTSDRATIPPSTKRSDNRAQKRRLQEEARKEKRARESAERKAAAERFQRLAAERIERERLLKQEQEERERQEREQWAAALAWRKTQLEEQCKSEAKVVEKHLVGGESTSSHGSLVTFVAGLEIQHIVTGFELCKITIKNLPDSATRKQVEDIFTDQGVSVADFHFLRFTEGGATKGTGRSNGHREALVLANSEYGEAIALGLQEIEFGTATLSFEVSENASWSASEGNSFPFLTVSWNIPSHALLAYYETPEHARQLCQELDGWVWRGARLSARLEKNMIVRVINCPSGAEDDEEFTAMTQATFIVQAGGRETHYDHDETLDLLREFFSCQPGAKMETFEVITTAHSAGGESKVKVQFGDWDEVKNTHASINRKRLNMANTGVYEFGASFFGYSTPIMRPWYPKPLQYQIKIPCQQYEAQKRQWDGLEERKRDVNAYVVTRKGDRGDVFVKVLGEDKTAAGALKVRVESLVAGESLDTAHWHPSFLSTHETRDLFRRIRNHTNAHVYCDRKSRLLKVYGEPDALQQVKRFVRDEVRQRESTESSRVVEADLVGFFMREGLDRLKELIGEENARIDVRSRPCRIMVKGGDAAQHHLQRMVDVARETVAFGTALPRLDEQQETCPICYDDVSSPEQLGCGHTYCSGCLKHFLESALESDSKSFPIKCMGADATCNTPLSIPFLRRFLSEQTFKQLMDVAFNAYLEQHADEIKYCTTPDCKQIYRRETHKVTIQCPTCFATVCSRCCEEAHEGMTCDERRLLRNPQEQERLNDLLAQQSGFKKCPRCSIWIEKNEGCNHMSCKCGAHICWRCMKSFAAAGEVYEHMNNEHGNIYDEAPVGVREIAGANNNDAQFLAEQADALARIARERMYEPLINPFALNAQAAAPRLRIRIADMYQLPANPRQGLPVGRREEARPGVVHQNLYGRVVGQRHENLREQREEEERNRRIAALQRDRQENMRRQRERAQQAREEEEERNRRNAALQQQQDNRGFWEQCTVM